MKKDDLYQQNREAWLEEAFRDAKEATEYRQDPKQYAIDKAKELNKLNTERYEREQANKKAAQEDEAAKREARIRELEAKEKRLKELEG